MEQGPRDSLMDLRPGYRTRVREDGAGDPLVLIHGTPLDSPRTPGLARRCRVGYTVTPRHDPPVSQGRNAA